MGDKTKIEWTDTTWNPIRGCSRKSAGCQGCYAEAIAARFSGPGQPFEGLAHRVGGEARWTGKVRLIEDKLTEPLRWRRPRRIFVNSVSDLFHENLTDEEIDKVFAVMALATHHTFQVLTKRADRMLAYLSKHDRADFVWDAVRPMIDDWYSGEMNVRLRCLGDDPYLFAIQAHGASWGGERPWPLRNVWLGVSVEDQAAADERIPDLLAAPAELRFLSCEPLIGPIRLDNLDDPSGDVLDGLTGKIWDEHGSIWRRKKIDWVIAGGESGRTARPAHPDWFRSLRDQCSMADVPFFFKQWGEWHPDALAYTDAVTGENPPKHMKIGKNSAGRLLDGRTHDEFPKVTP